MAENNVNQENVSAEGDVVGGNKTVNVFGSTKKTPLMSSIAVLNMKIAKTSTILWINCSTMQTK